MSGDPTAFSDTLTTITAESADVRKRLGTIRIEYHPTLRRRVWRYVLMRGGNIAAGEGVMQETGTDVDEVIISGAATPNARLRGVAQHAITQNYGGWVLCLGAGSCASDGSTTANTIQATAASGRFTDGTAVTSENSVWSQAASGTPGGTFQALIQML